MTIRPYVTKAGQTLVDRALSRLLPELHLTSRFDPIFLDGPRPHLLRANLAAHRRFHGIDARGLTQVGLFAFARGGSHLIGAQLHYPAPCFCLDEGILDFHDVNWRTFLLRGIFGIDSVQEKSGSALTHLIYMGNSPTAYRLSAWNPIEHSDLTRYWVFVTRNPFRILRSRAATHKEKWELTVSNASDVFLHFRSMTEHFRKLRRTIPDRTIAVSVESFFLNHEARFKRLCEQIGLPPRSVVEAPQPVDFFKKVVRCASEPVLEGAYLVSPKSGQKVLARGGGFNPILPIEIPRLFSSVEKLPDEIVKSARQILGDTAVEFYLNDSPHRYQNLDDDWLLDLIGRREKVA